MKKTEELDELLRRLAVSSENCNEMAIDLRRIKFISNEEEMFLEDKPTGEKLFFKMNKENPKDKLSTHAVRQFCKAIDMPFDFMMDNRPEKRNEMVNSWITSTAPEEGDENLILVKFREGGNIKVIRALLPLNYASLENDQVVSLLSKYPKDVEVDVDWHTGTERDTLSMHCRLIYKDELDGEYYPGVSIINGSLGSSDLIVDSFLYHIQSKTYLYTNYGNDPFAKVQYNKVQPSEVSEVLTNIPSRVHEEAEIYLETLNAKDQEYPGLERLCHLLSTKKGVPPKFRKLIYLEAESCQDDMETMKDFLRHAGMVAKDFSLNQRIKIERAIGSFAGMTYNKK